MSRVAADNPLAWRREALDAATIRDQGMLAFPYTRWHASEWNVDQAAALIFCSARLARRLGATPRKWLFPHAAAQCNAMTPLSLRPEPHRYPDLKRARGGARRRRRLRASRLRVHRSLQLLSGRGARPGAGVESGLGRRGAADRDRRHEFSAAARSTTTPFRRWRRWRRNCAGRRTPPPCSVRSAASCTSRVWGCGRRDRRPSRGACWTSTARSRRCRRAGTTRAAPKIVGCTVLHQKGEAEVAVALCGRRRRRTRHRPQPRRRRHAPHDGRGMSGTPRSHRRRSEFRLGGLTQSIAARRGADRRRAVVGAEDGVAGDEGVGPGGENLADVVGVDAAVDLDARLAPLGVDHLAPGASVSSIVDGMKR